MPLLLVYAIAIARGATRGERLPPAPALPSAKPLVPWWSREECARLTSSPPPAVVALRKLHAAAQRGEPGCTVGLMRGGVNNVRQANYMALVVAVLTGRRLSACSAKNDIGYRFDRETIAASVGMRNDGCCGTKWTEVAGLGGDIEGTSQSVSDWIATLSSEPYRSAAVLATAATFGSPAYAFQLGNDADPLAAYIDSVLRACYHPKDELWREAKRMRSLLPSSFTAVNVRHKYVDAPVLNCSAHGWGHYAVSEKHVSNMRVPCVREDGSKVTLVDAVLMAAPLGGSVYLAGVGPEIAARKELELLGYSVYEYERDLLPQYRRAFRSPGSVAQEEPAFAHDPVVDQIIIAAAARYVGDYPSSFTEGAVDYMRWLESDARERDPRPGRAGAFQGASNYAAFNRIVAMNAGQS